MKKTVDLVLPVHPVTNGDSRRMRICLSSLDRYLDPSSVGRLLIVVPDAFPKGSVQALTWEGRTLRFETRVLNDHEVLGHDRWRARVGGWYTQQFVKIGAADQLSSDFYVTLDSDVLLTRDTTFDDLVPDGRAATLYHARDVHSIWWTGSAKLLDTEPGLDRLGMGVTPAVLSSEVARGLMRYLEKTYAGPWYRPVVERLDELKATGHWPPRPFDPCPHPTEYTLYYLFAEKMQLASRYHVPSSTLWCGQQVFRPAEMQTLSARLTLAAADPGRFFVLQSILGLSPERVWNEVAGPLGLSR